MGMMSFVTCGAGTDMSDTEQLTVPPYSVDEAKRRIDTAFARFAERWPREQIAASVLYEEVTRVLRGIGEGGT